MAGAANGLNLQIPQSRLVSFKGKIIVFSYSIKTKTGTEIVNGQYVAEILNNPPIFEVQDNVDTLLYVTVAGDDVTKKAYFESGKSYKLWWKLSGFTGASKA